MIWLIQQLLHIRTVFKSGDTPRQLAFGLALGVMLGLVMSGNLLAVGLTILVCATRANLSMAALSTLCVSFLAPYADPLTHRIGEFVLTQPALETTFVRLYEVPLMPWTDFNQTIVMGSFVLGAVLVYPTYRATLPIFRRWRRKPATETSRPEVIGAQEDVVDTSTKEEAVEAVVTDTSSDDEKTEASTTQTDPKLAAILNDVNEDFESRTEHVDQKIEQRAETSDQEVVASKNVVDKETTTKKSVETSFMDLVRARLATAAQSDSPQTVTADNEPPKSETPEVKAATPDDGFNDRTPPRGVNVKTTNGPKVVPTADINAFREIPKSNYGFNADASE